MVAEVEVLKLFNRSNSVGDICGIDDAIAEELAAAGAVRIRRRGRAAADPVEGGHPSGAVFDLRSVARDLTQHPAFADLIDPATVHEKVETLRRDSLEATHAVDTAQQVADKTWPIDPKLEA